MDPGTESVIRQIHPTKLGLRFVTVKRGYLRHHFKWESDIILQPTGPLVLQLPQSTKRWGWGERKCMKIISVSLKVLRITEIALFKHFIYFFREKGREGEEHLYERETSISCLSHAPNQGPCLQPRHVP